MPYDSRGSHIAGIKPGEQAEKKGNV